MFPSVVSTATLAALMIASLAPGADAKGAFATCLHDRWAIQSNQYIYSSCRMDKEREGRRYQYNRLDGNKCIGNENGRLVRRDDGNFANSCRECKMEKNSAWLNCVCRDVFKKWGRTRLDLNNHFSNYDGRLCCKGNRDYCGEPIWRSEG